MGKELIPKAIEDLAGAREWLKIKLLKSKACKCPVCGQTAKLYPRKLSSEQARFLIDVYRLTARKKPGERWLSPAKDLIHKADHYVTHDYGKLRFWGLLEPSKAETGMWRITPAGMAFVEGKLVVPQKAYVYNNCCVRLGKNTTDIKGALGAKFDVKELLRGASLWG